MTTKATFIIVLSFMLFANHSKAQEDVIECSFSNAHGEERNAGGWSKYPYTIELEVPHRRPGQSGPNRHSIPMVTFPFVSMNITPFMRCYHTAN